MQPVTEIIERRVRALARRFHFEQLPPLVVARNLQGACALACHGGGQIESLPSFDGNAYIWRRQTADDSEIWVRTNSPYRKIFREAITTLYGASDVDFSGFQDFHVDHIFNEANAFDGDFLRVEGVIPGVNMSHGAAIEKHNTHSTRHIATRGRKEQRLMTFIMVLKLAGFKAPRGINDTRLVAIRHYFQASGWGIQEIDNALANLLSENR